MTRREKEIERIEREIERLKEKLEKLKSEPEIYGDKSIFYIDDFPFKGIKSMYLYNAGIRTVEDLVYSKKSDILFVRSFGKSSLKTLEEWMDKHDLKFLG